MHMESSDEDEEEAAPYSSVNMHEVEILLCGDAYPMTNVAV